MEAYLLHTVGWRINSPSSHTFPHCLRAGGAADAAWHVSLLTTSRCAAPSTSNVVYPQLTCSEIVCRSWLCWTMRPCSALPQWWQQLPCCWHASAWANDVGQLLRQLRGRVGLHGAAAAPLRHQAAGAANLCPACGWRSIPFWRGLSQVPRPQVGSCWS